jgi:hypothetical protein
MTIDPKKITYQKRGEDGYVVRADDDRIGIVRKVDGVWHAADTFFVGFPGTFKTRRSATNAMLKRFRRQVKEGLVP